MTEDQAWLLICAVFLVGAVLSDESRAAWSVVLFVLALGAALGVFFG